MAIGRGLFADVMLGRLARKLRLLGIDTLYGSASERPGLLESASEGGRTILTRDTRLQTHGCRRLLIRSDLWPEQVRQVLEELPLDPRELAPFSRCSRCNTPIEPVDRETVEGRVPPYTYATHDRFLRCPWCGRIYWSGTHVTRIRDRLGRLVMGQGHP